MLAANSIGSTMLRRKRLTAKQQSLLTYKRTAPISIFEPMHDDTDEVEVIAAVRAHIWLTRHVCQLCAGRRQADCAGFPDEMHEDPSRSQTRGLPPKERFNLRVCGRLCKACHRDVTEHKIRIVFTDPALGFLAPVTTEKVRDGHDH